MELTLDADVVIESRAGDAVNYRRLSTGERWRVLGTCNQCGLCAIGAIGAWYVWDGPAGTPNASRDTRAPSRLDDPICGTFVDDMRVMAALTPTATVDGCSLTVEVL